MTKRSAQAKKLLEQRQILASELPPRSEEHTSELQSQSNLVCRLLLEKKTQPASKQCRVLRSPGCGRSAPPPQTPAPGALPHSRARVVPRGRSFRAPARPPPCPRQSPR